MGQVVGTSAGMHSSANEADIDYLMSPIIHSNNALIGAWN